jgi:hypothetical protein
MTSRDDREYREYLREEQPSPDTRSCSQRAPSLAHCCWREGIIDRDPGRQLLERRTALPRQRTGAPNGVGFDGDQTDQLGFSRAVAHVCEAMQECTDTFEAGVFA